MLQVFLRRIVPLFLDRKSQMLDDLLDRVGCQIRPAQTDIRVCGAAFCPNMAAVCRNQEFAAALRGVIIRLFIRAIHDVALITVFPCCSLRLAALCIYTRLPHLRL